MRQNGAARAAARLVIILAALAGPARAQQDVLIEKSTNGQDADVPPGPVLLVGAPVVWTYTVTNSGSRDLANIAVADDQGVLVTCPGTVLAAGESFTCTGSGTAQEGQYANVGTVTADLPNGAQVTDSDPSHYFGQSQALITLEKATEGQDADLPPGPSLPVGSPVSWTYAVTNIGTEPLAGVTVTDDQGVAVSCPGTTLAAGESMTCTGSGTVQPGPYVNLGTVTAMLPDGSVTGASDPSHHFGYLLALEKSTNGEDADLPPGPTLAFGSPVAWTYVVSNSGPDPLTGVTVTDDQGVAVTCPGTTLAAGESMTCTGSGTAQAGQYANTGTVTAVDAIRGELSASDRSHYYGQEQVFDVAISASKTAALLADGDGDGQADPGDTLLYTVVLVNSGTDPATGAIFTDAPDPNTALVAGTVATTQGTVTGGNSPGDTAVAVDVGTLAAGEGTATITFQVAIDAPFPAGVDQVVNQGVLSGSNFADVPTDDPAEPGPADATAVDIAAPQPVEIPTLSEWSLLAFALLLAGLALRRTPAAGSRT